MRCYGLRAALFAAALCAALLAGASLWLGLVGAAVVSALLVALGWIIFFHSERSVLAALRARPVSEVERPDLYRIVRELAFSAHLPVPRLYVSPAAQPNILTVGYSARSAAVCCTEGLLRLLTLSELRAVLAHELAHVARHDVAVSSWSAGLASLVASCPLIAVLLHITAPCGREYSADIDGALLTGDPMALARALEKIDTVATAQPLRPRGTLAAASHLMIAHPFTADGVGGLLSTHPPTSERVRRLEVLSGGPRLPGGWAGSQRRLVYWIAKSKSLDLSRLMTDCRSSLLLDDTRNSSPCTCALTPFGPSSLMIFATFLALSWVMPSFRAIARRYSLPDNLGSAGSRCLSETPRLTSLSLKTSRTAFARSSLLARISTPLSPDQAMEAPTPRKSNRVLISLAAWLSALSASCRSIFDTMSKLDSLGMDHRLDG